MEKEKDPKEEQRKEYKRNHMKAKRAEKKRLREHKEAEEKQRKQEAKEARQKKKEEAEAVRQKKELKKEKDRERKKRKKEQQQNKTEALLEVDNDEPPFKYRKLKKQCLDRVKEDLPKSPKKKAVIVEELLKSPNTRRILENKGVINSHENQEKVQTANTLTENIKEGLNTLKNKRSKEAISTFQAGVSLINGPNIKEKNTVSKIATQLGIGRKVVSKAIVRHENIINGTEGALRLAERRARIVIPVDHKLLAIDFWTSKGVSRPTGNKRDVVRKRLAPKTYAENEKHVLDVTQTEAYLMFREKHPEAKMCQRTFEGLKPYFVSACSKHDRVGCCCRYCVEEKMVSGVFMKERRKILKNNENVETTRFPVYEHGRELMAATMCSPKTMDCVKRKCNLCGTSKLNIMPEEKSDREVTWEKYTYKVMPSGKRKLTIVSETTPHKELTEYLIKLVNEYPLHQVTAKWQNNELEEALDNLPKTHALVVHDYSENYTCRPNFSTHSQYIDPEQASLHISVITRHATPYDGIQGTEAEQTAADSLIWEHFAVICPSLQHDSSSVHDIRVLLAKHFADIDYGLTVLEEFTDGCSSQYKSRNCFYDVSCSEEDFGFITRRNFFGTAHAKGPQDAAGGRIKLHCDLGCIKKGVKIQSARDAYNYLQETFTSPTTSGTKKAPVKLKRRIFKYEEKVNGSQRFAKTITTEKVRKLHAIRSCGESGTLYVRELSCYCTSCMDMKYDECLQKEWVPAWRKLILKPQDSPSQEADDDENTEAPEGPVEMLKGGEDVAVSDGEHITNGEIEMFQVTNPTPVTLRVDSIDPWSDPIPLGNSVLEGQNYKLEKVEKRGRVYTLLPDRAHIRVSSVLCICQTKVSKRKAGQFKFMSQKEYDNVMGLLQ